MSQSLDWSKPLKTRSGLDVRVFDEHIAKSSFPIVGTVRNVSGFDFVSQWTENGVSQKSPDLTLVNVSPIVEIEIFYFECVQGIDAGQRFSCLTKNYPGLRFNSDYKILARKKIQIIEGEGL